MAKSLGFKEFNIAIDKFAAEAPEMLLPTVQLLAQNGLRLLVNRTPVGYPPNWKSPPPPGYVGGTARANWQVTVGAPAQGVVAAVDPNGSATIEKGSSVIFGITEPFVQIWISNNLPYIEELERGHSTQAPTGMLAVTVEDLRSVFD